MASVGVARDRSGESASDAVFASRARDGSEDRGRLPEDLFPRGWVRLGMATVIPALMRERGIDPDRLLAMVGLDPALFEDPDNRVAVDRLGRLFGLCQQATRCEHFGLLVGRGAGPSALGAVGCLAQHSQTVGDALDNLVRHFHHHDRGAAPSLRFQGDVAMLGYAVFVPEVEAVDQLGDSVIAAAFNLLRAICGPGWQPSEVLLGRRVPADPMPFRQFFGSAVRFNQETAAIVFPAHWLAKPVAGADPVLRRILERRVAELEMEAPQSLSDRLRSRLRAILLREKCSIEAVAQHLDLHPRTLRRRLLEENTTYSALVDEVRFEIARQLLSVTSLTAGEIASALDYGDSAAFTRAFKRWSGLAPSAWRLAEAAR